MALTSLFVLECCTRVIRPRCPCPDLYKNLSLSVTFVCLCSIFLSEQLSQDVAEMLLVVQREVEEDGSWLNPDNTKK